MAMASSGRNSGVFDSDSSSSQDIMYGDKLATFHYGANTSSMQSLDNGDVTAYSINVVSGGANATNANAFNSRCSATDDTVTGFHYNTGNSISPGNTSRSTDNGSVLTDRRSSLDESLIYSRSTTPSSVSASSGGTTSSKTGSGARCSVCGDEASGFHYGVDSCEGCKGFFRRCVIQGLPQTCANSEKCEITPLTRNSCQYCRMKKCFAVGMSRGASRLGRRPKRLKPHYSGGGSDIKDAQGPATAAGFKSVAIAPQPEPVLSNKLPLTVQELEGLLEKLNSQNRYSITLPSLLAALNSLLKDNASQVNDTMASSSSTTTAAAVSRSGPSTSTRQLSPDTTGPRETSGSMSPLTDSINTMCQIKTESCLMSPPASTMLYYNNTNNSDDGQPMSASHITSSFDARALVDSVYHRLHEEEQRRKMFDEMPVLGQLKGQHSVVDTAWEPSACTASATIDIPNDCIEAMQAMDPAERQSLEELMEEARRLPDASSERCILVQDVIKDVIAAHMNTCNYTSEKVRIGMARYIEAQHFQTDRTVSEDIDPMKIWSAFVKNMEPVILRVLNFSKSLPAFSELCQDDKIKLIKQGSFEVVLARYVPLFTDDGIFIPDMTVRVPYNVVQSMPLGDFFGEQYRFARCMNRLKLTDGEIALLTAIMIINPGRAGLENFRAVYKLRGLLLQCLYIHMKTIRPETYEETFLGTIYLLPLSDQINKLHASKINNLKVMSPDLKLPELHNEVYDGLP